MKNVNILVSEIPSQVNLFVSDKTPMPQVAPGDPLAVTADLVPSGNDFTLYPCQYYIPLVEENKKPNLVSCFSGKVCNNLKRITENTIAFGLNIYVKNEKLFINCIAQNQLADILSNSVGSYLGVAGRFSFRVNTLDDGRVFVKPSLYVTDFSFAGSKKDSAAPSPQFVKPSAKTPSWGRVQGNADSAVMQAATGLDNQELAF